jgi:pilus assembly protein Flp/PilA
MQMSCVLSSISRFLTSDDGPTAVEYAVMTALIVVACVNVIAALDSTLRGTFTTVNSTLTAS